MNTTGRAKGPGPHRTHVRETQKRGVVRQARKGFTVRCFWVAARDWPCRVHRQTKGGFVRSGPADPAKVRPVSLGHFARPCSHPPAPAAAGFAFLGPRSMRVRDAWGHRRPRPDPPRLAPRATARVLVRCARGARRRARLAPPPLGTLSARASRGLARPDSRRRPRRSPRPWRASAHRGRCRAA